MNPAIDFEGTLGRLKDFQRRTVEYVFRRLYLDAEPALRFLVADEVGLGKTLVAKGIIAKTIEHLRQKGGARIDIVYICSNAAIASQNIDRLNVFGKQNLPMATRLTMLPKVLQCLNGNEVNFISFTPGTSFDLQSSGGVRHERVLLFQLLRGQFGISETNLLNVLQGRIRNRDRWREEALTADVDFDTALQGKFLVQLGREQLVLNNMQEVATRFQRYRDEPPPADVVLRNKVIGNLRLMLAQVCVDELKPDLVILDEFQRFKDLLDGDAEDEAAQLARTLFSTENSRVLLLSATPYKMFTLDREVQDDHYEDFFRTLRFLLRDDEKAVSSIKDELADFRKAMYRLGDGAGATATRDRIQKSLRAVIARTERVSVTSRHDAMLVERPVPVELASADLHQARFVGSLATKLQAGDVIEYCKSSPYLLNFMRDYKFKQKFEETTVSSDFQDEQDCLLPVGKLERYEEIEPANSRLRALIRETVSAGQWKVLWVPPCLPYIEPSGPYKDQAGMTKSLIFSSWQVVPDVIAALCSYEAERQMLGAGRADLPAYSELNRVTKGLLRFTVGADGRPTGMPVLCLLYPSPALAQIVDPLQMAMAENRSLPPDEMRRLTEIAIRAQLEPLLKQKKSADGRTDQRWYWAALPLMDVRFHGAVPQWLKTPERWRSCVSDDEDESASAFTRHVADFLAAGEMHLDLGRPPDDLVEVVAEIALAGPGVCALRALRRVATEFEWDSPVLMGFAAQIAAASRTLFNLPETMALLRSDDLDVPYWRRAIQHGIQGNLQSVLDEYVHCLEESLGVSERPVEEAVGKIAAAIADVLSLRTSRVKADDIRPGTEKRDFNFRSRFAIRLGDITDDSSDKITRVDTVRLAFNSPFRPFVLATTSIGQEGLDLHTYCHVVYHWNLPPNPVDLEQREGRVQRYKGHAVRRNVALDVGVSGIRSDIAPQSDPWKSLFRIARSRRPANSTDLIPYWIYEMEGGARVERRVLILPFSREERRFPSVKQSLAVYRLVFGQPRQEDLVAHLAWRAASGQDHFGDFNISLAPPESEFSVYANGTGMSMPRENGATLQIAAVSNDAIVVRPGELLVEQSIEQDRPGASGSTVAKAKFITDTPNGTTPVVQLPQEAFELLAADKTDSRVLALSPQRGSIIAKVKTVISRITSLWHT